MHDSSPGGPGLQARPLSLASPDLHALLGAQLPSGAFRSVIVFGDREEDDANGFTTALVLRALRQRATAADGPALDSIRDRALAFLERCASPGVPGAFAFWPPDARPRWAASVTADLDDTAVITLELLLHGRRSLEQARESVLRAIAPFAITRVPPPAPPWVHPGAFPTWIAADSHRANPVDCCVNANIVALMARVSLRHVPGYAEACATILDAVTWAGDDAPRLHAIAPYYPDPRELAAAVEHAVACGAGELTPVVPRLRAACRVRLSAWRAHAVCGNAYGPPCWRMPILEALRAEDEVRAFR